MNSPSPKLYYWRCCLPSFSRGPSWAGCGRAGWPRRGAPGRSGQPGPAPGAASQVEPCIIITILNNKVYRIRSRCMIRRQRGYSKEYWEIVAEKATGRRNWMRPERPNLTRDKKTRQELLLFSFGDIYEAMKTTCCLMLGISSCIFGKVGLTFRLDA